MRTPRRGSPLPDCIESGSVLNSDFWGRKPHSAPTERKNVQRGVVVTAHGQAALVALMPPFLDPFRNHGPAIRTDLTRAMTKAAQLGNEDVRTFHPKRGSRQGKGVVAVARAKAWIARSLARPDAAEERLESMMDAAQGLSCEYNRKGANGLVFPAKFGQFLGLLEVTHPFPMRSPSAGSFFERRIVEFGGRPAAAAGGASAARRIGRFVSRCGILAKCSN
jgi:hypothetical protein